MSIAARCSLSGPLLRKVSRAAWRLLQQYLTAGLLDEILVSIVPVILGSRAPLLDNLGDPKPKLHQVEAIAASGVTHIGYARV